LQQLQANITSLTHKKNTVFEKLLYNRLYSYIEQHNMLSEHQYLCLFVMYH